MNDPHHPDPAGATALADPTDARRLALAERLRALSHPVRLTMLETLGTADRCVCGELVRALPLAQSTVSQHLKVLREAELVTVREEGQHRFYSLSPAPLDIIDDWLVPFFDDGLIGDADPATTLPESAVAAADLVGRAAASAKHAWDSAFKRIPGR